MDPLRRRSCSSRPPAAGVDLISLAGLVGLAGQVGVSLVGVGLVSLVGVGLVSLVGLRPRAPGASPGGPGPGDGFSLAALCGTAGLAGLALRNWLAPSRMAACPRARMPG